MNKKEAALEWAKQDEMSKRWLTHIQTNKTGSHKTQLAYAYRLKRFCDWAKKTPSQLIVEREEQLKGKTKQEREKTEDLVNDFFQFQSKPHEGEKGNHRVSAKGYYGALRSFIKCNSDAGLKGDTPRGVSRTIRGITLEEFKQIDTIINPRDRALLRFMKDSSCSTEDVVVFNYGDIRKDFEAGKEFIHLRAVRQKTQMNYDTFIGRNAVEALKTYFQLRKQHGEIFNDETPVFLSSLTKSGKRTRLNENTLRTVFARIKQKSGIIVSPHRIRKLFSTCMAMKVRHPIVLKYWMGHSVGGSGDVEGSYVLPDLSEQLKAYMEAYGQIDIAPKADEKEREMQNLINSAIAMGLSTDKVEEIRKVAKRETSLTVEEFAKMIKDALKPKISTNCNDGKHCQRIVSEEELSLLLSNGWMFVATLPSGKILVGNDT